MSADNIIHIHSPQGIAPRYGARKLNSQTAQVAHNVDLWSHELRPILKSLRVNNPTKTGTIQSIYPLGGFWLHWTSDVDVIPAPLDQLAETRIYYTGDYQPKVTDVELVDDGFGENYPLSYYRLGLPGPDNGPTIGITGGSSGTPETRSYVYTYVTEWGEEGPPSPATEHQSANDDATSWDLSVMDVAPPNSGTITNITVAGTSTTFTTTDPHFLETGDYVEHASIVGTGDLPGALNNQGPVKVTRLGTNSYSIEVAPSGSYTSGGTWDRESTINTSNMVKRIYRTVNGQFRYVDEIPVTQTTYSDIKTNTEVASSVLLASTNWVSPPSNLTGLRVLSNGSVVGFYGNVLAFTPKYVPHAWPPEYELTFPHEIVAIEVIGSSVIVATIAQPYLVSGIDPSAMSEVNLEIDQSCVSKKSMKKVLNGAIYASPDGLVYVPVAGVPQIMTRNWLKKPDWEKYNPQSLIGAVYDDRYFGFYTDGGEDGDESGAIVFDPSEANSTFTTLSTIATATYTDRETDTLYLMEDSSITKWGAGGAYQIYTWKSKIFTTPRPVALDACMMRVTIRSGFTEEQLAEAVGGIIDAVAAKLASYEITETGEFNGATANTYEVNGGPYLDGLNELGGVTISNIKVYAKGVLIAEKDVADSKPFRLGIAEKYDTYEIEINGSDVEVHEVILAETMSELRAT